MKKILLFFAALALAFSAMAETATFTISSAEVVSGKTGDVALGTNAYGSQAVATQSTWYTCEKGDFAFTGAKICVAQASAGGGLQFQGNASDAAKQGFFGNTTSFTKITKITLTLRVVSTSTFAPSFNVYVGAAQLPATGAVTLPTVTPTEADGFKTYVYEINVSGNNGYFAIRNDLAGALYLDEISIEYVSGEVAASAEAPSLTTAGIFSTASYDVTITNNEEGATVYYTTDGTDPTTSSASFTGASTTIQISATTTVKAMAVISGKDNSGVASAIYTYVAPVENTAETAYSVEEAIALIDSNNALLTSTEVYVTGVISDVESFNSTYGSITYWLDEKTFEIYGGLNLSGAKFTALSNLSVGDRVVVKGKIKKYNTTYEMDKNNVLISRVPTSASVTTPTTTWMLSGAVVSTAVATLGTTFLGPEFNTDSNGEVTFTSSATSVATIDDAGMVTLVGAGTTVITATTAATSTYSESSASYTLTVNQPLVAAALPFEFDGGAADVASTTGMSANGLGSNYAASPKLKLDGAGDYVEVFYAEAAKTVTFTVKGNGGTNADWDGQFDVLESTDGTTFTTVHSYVSGNLTSTAATITLDLNADSRYVKFVYVTKTTGNVALGNIRIAAASERELPVLAFGQESYNFYTDDEDKAVVATSSNSTGAITYALTEGDDEAFLIDETTGDIVCETAGTYTVTATIAATETHEAGTATCTVVIANRPAASSYYALVSSYTADGVTRYFAMGSEWENKALNAVEVYMANGVAVTTGSKDEISWMLDADGHVVNKAGEYITYSKGDITLTESSSSSFTEEEDDNGLYWKADTRSFIYRESSNQFKNYAVSNAGNSGYGTIAYLTDAAEGFVVPALTEGKMGTICLDRTVEVADLYGANFYTVTSATATEVTCTLETDGLLAGYPYIYVIDDMDEATTSGVADLIAVYSGDAEVTEGASNNHFYGVLEETTLTDGELYVLSSKTGQFVKCGEGWKVAANEAYLDLNSLVGTASAAAHRAPNANAANSIVISVGGGVATALNNADAAQVEKIFRNGQVVIIKNGVEYNAIGQKL